MLRMLSKHTMYMIPNERPITAPTREHNAAVASQLIVLRVLGLKYSQDSSASTVTEPEHKTRQLTKVATLITR